MNAGTTRSRWSLRAAGLVLGLALAVAVAEMVLRSMGVVAFQRNPLGGFYDQDPLLGWAGTEDYTARFKRPDFDVVISNDEHGFRKRETPLAAAASPRRRTAFLGDSFTWGWGVSGACVFTEELQRLVGDSAEIDNYGVNAYGTGQELILLERKVLPTHPDRIVVMFCANDLRDNVDEKGGRRPCFRMEDGVLVRTNSPVRTRVYSPLGGLWRRSVALSLLRYEANRLLSTARRDFDGDGPDAADEILAGDAESSPELWAIEKGILAAMQADCLASEPKSELRVVFIPPSTDVVRRGSGAGTGTGARTEGARLSRICAELGIPCLDPTEEFARAWKDDPGRGPAGEPYYFPHDEHWTCEGHRLAARTMKSAWTW